MENYTEQKKTEWISTSVAETEAIGAQLAAMLDGPGVIAMFGGMGCGKTALTRGFVRGLGLNDEVSSPTFALVNVYGRDSVVAHYDMYRITSWEDLYSTGFFDYIDMGAIVLVEWSENIENALPDTAWRLTLERLGDNERRITLERN